MTIVANAKKGVFMKTEKHVHQLNFNKVENQHRCVYRSHQPMVGVIAYRPVILQYFIYNRNYGWVSYHDRIYNLNLQQQADCFLETLIHEGFLERTDTGFTVLDEQYEGFINVPRHQLLYYLSFSKASLLSEADCLKHDQLAQQSL